MPVRIRASPANPTPTQAIAVTDDPVAAIIVTTYFFDPVNSSHSSFPSRLRLWSVLVACTGMSSGLMAQSDSYPPLLSVSSGFDYSRGSYGFDTDTEVFMVPVNFSYETGSWVFRAGLPWIRVDGPANVASGGQFGAVPERPTMSSESGLGDATLGATYRFAPVFETVNIDLTGRLKFGTADVDKGLGTGENDQYLQADFSRSFGALTPFVTVGYRFMGSSPAYPLRDGAFYSGGLFYRYSPYTSYGVAYDWRQRLMDGGDPARELTGFLVHRLDDRWSVQVYALTGFSDASADLGGGALVNYRY